MDLSQIPFTLYDFFGYIASGITAISAFIYFSDYWLPRSWRLTSLNWVLTIILAYVLGHVLSSLSKWLYELIIVRKGLKDPFINLFKEGKGIKKILFPEYFEPFPKEIRRQFPPLGSTETQQALFCNAYKITINKKDVLSRLDTFLALYGFCRTMSFTTLCASILFLLKGHNVPGLAIFCFVLAIFLFLRYLKFFRQYSYELFLSTIDKSADKSTGQ